MTDLEEQLWQAQEIDTSINEGDHGPAIRDRLQAQTDLACEVLEADFGLAGAAEAPIEQCALQAQLCLACGSAY